MKSPDELSSPLQGLCVPVLHYRITTITAPLAVMAVPHPRNEAIRHPLTYAVKHLKQVVTFACGKEDAPVYVGAKAGTQKKNGYKNMAILFHEFVHPKMEHLNFLVKLTIGIKSDGKHVQYCVNKIETQNNKPIVSSDYPS